MSSAPSGRSGTPLPPTREQPESDAPEAPAHGSPAGTGSAGAAADPPPVPAAAKTEETGKKPVKQRDAFFDNAKYLAIVLVAMGHSWEPLRDGSRAVTALYMVVYAFHMPAFIIISGYFSRSFDFRPDRVRRLLTGVVVPYVVFETAFSLFKRYADHDPGQDISLMDPWFLTWFLIALFIWRITAPIWKLVRWPLPIALVIACLASISPSIGDDLDLQRVLQFLPYFVLGLTLRPEHFRMVRQRRVRIAAVPVFVVALVFSYWAVRHMTSSWFMHRDAAQELGTPWWAGIVMTLAVFGCSMVLTACFFSWVPGRHMWFTTLGAGTLYGYLLHGFVVKSASFYGWYHPGFLHQPLGEVLVTVAAAAVVTVLCTGPVRRVFKYVMEPEMAWAFRQDPAEQARKREHGVRQG
jgi:fucose 4-O-acetylase-like acetyltransferase